MEKYEREHRERVRELAAGCVVLLRSDGSFPLDAACDVALYGGGARRTVPGGTGSGEVNTRFNMSVEKGLEKAGFHITTKDWLTRYDQEYAAARRRFVNDIRKRARAAHMNPVSFGMGAVMPEPEYRIPLTGTGDTAVYVLARSSGEGADRSPVPGDILLTETEKRDILFLQRKYKRFLLALNVGGAVDLSPLEEVKNILLLSQLGSVTGEVLADILLGKAAPSGRLADTWSAWGDYRAEGDFGGKNDTRYSEGIYVGYRYFDAVGKKPLFPFGYGLSYTSFSTQIVKTALERETVTVTAEIENTGSLPGREVLEVYVSVPAGRLDQPPKTLAAYAKTRTLKPGQAETVTASFRLSEIASYDEERSAWVLEAGAYIVLTGRDSQNVSPAAVVKLPQNVVTLKVKRAFAGAGFEDWKPAAPARPELPDNIPVFTADCAAISHGQTDYRRVDVIDPAVTALTDEELVYLGIGAFSPKGGIMSVIGNQAAAVAGAAGQTTTALADKGIGSLVMADGPAGLRLTPRFYRDAEGAHGIGAGMPESFLEYLPSPARAVMRLLNKKPPKDAVIEEQYAVSIPIGTALAQSWDPRLCESCGDLIGSEMERFGVHLWLAPALNLHRDIRCGRNFEYYSEDPLIAGLTAAAITRGVQRHQGRGVTIKHFAANNQETNRYNSNSRISERAFREMYLRGFGICVRRARPRAVMTSYNLVNGVHTSESRELIEDVLRCEFGFDGIVMTDWVIAGQSDSESVYPGAASPNVAKAGGELFMPGSAEDYKALLDAVKEGKVERAQLLRNASHLVRMIAELTEQTGL